MSAPLFDLLHRRMADESLGPGDPVGVAELHRRLLPYHTCRDLLGYATKAEYDLAVLRLLADERRVAVSEPALREAVQSEIRQPEPGLAFLHRFAAAEIRLKGEPAGRPAGPGPASTDPDAVPVPADAPGPAGCRRCATSLPRVDGARYCPACGADQLFPTCADCGAEIDEQWSYCAFCGRLQDARA